MGLTGCMQKAPFILVGYRLMSHMHLLTRVCMQVSGCLHEQMCSCGTCALMGVTIAVCQKSIPGIGDVNIICKLKVG